jgi:serine protease Do
VASTPPGTTVTLGILRDGKEMSLKVTLGELPGQLAGGTAPPSSTLRGITVQELTSDIRRQLGLPRGTQGVVIGDLDPESPAARAGLRPGDVIQSVNREPVASVEDFDRLAARATGEVLLRVNRGGASAFVVISPDEG